MKRSTKEFIKTGIKEFLQSRKKKLKFSVAPANILIMAAESVGCKMDNDTIETNGWDYDWWISGEYKNKKIRLSGSGYYGHGQIEWDNE